MASTIPAMLSSSLCGRGQRRLAHKGAKWYGTLSRLVISTLSVTVTEISLDGGVGGWVPSCLDTVVPPLLVFLWEGWPALNLVLQNATVAAVAFVFSRVLYHPYQSWRTDIGKNATRIPSGDSCSCTAQS